MAIVCNGFSSILRPSSRAVLTEFRHAENTAKLVPVARPEYLSIRASRPRRCHCLNGELSSVNFPSMVYFSTEYELKLESYLRHLLKSRQEDAEEDPMKSLIIADAIQRVGVGKRFQEEIQTILERHYSKTREGIYPYYCSLHDVSLSFRLFRQRGYHESPDVFNNFKGKDGRFRGELRQDIRGLLELYEATQLRFEGENILDEAEDFSSQLLEESLSDMDDKWSNIVHLRMRHPYHKTITRLTQKNFLTNLGDIKGGWEEALSQLVEMDFLVQQSLYQEEFVQVSKWWNDLGLTRDLKLARNQPLKWYIWSMTCLIGDISLSEQRVQLTKSIAFIYLIDDIFDLYGTPHELALFTQAVQKWDPAAGDTLPEYMKLCYNALLDATNEIGYEIYRRHGYNPIDHLKQTWASLCNAFLVEAKWFASSDLPRAEEYLDNGKVSSGVHVVLAHSFFLVGLGGTNGSAISLDDTSVLMSSVAAILRLWDDLGSAKDEHQDGRDGSYVACYMKDHEGLSCKQAREHVMNVIASEWKRLNKECFRLTSNSAASSFTEASLNLARMVPLMYSYDDNQRLPVLEEYVNSMFFNNSS